MKALLPALNSPTTTSRNGRASWSRESASALRVASGTPRPSSRAATSPVEAARLVEQGLPGGVERGAHGSSITPSRNFTAWPAISTRSPRSSHHSSPPRFETWRAKRLVLPRRFDQ